MKKNSKKRFKLVPFTFQPIEFKHGSLYDFAQKEECKPTISGGKLTLKKVQSLWDSLFDA